MDAPDETTSLIAVGKVSGTDVYDTDGVHLGVVHDVLIEKSSGLIACAVVTFGGMLGIGADYHQVPWHSLKYDTRQGGYVLGVPLTQANGDLAFASYAAAV